MTLSSDTDSSNDDLSECSEATTSSPPETSRNSDIDNPAPPSPEATPSSPPVKDTTSTNPSSAVIVLDGGDETDIPDPFPFPPHYNPELELALKLKCLQPKQFAKFVTWIANVMFLYKRYPTRRKYERVGQQVIKKYPFLSSPMDPYVSYVYSSYLTVIVVHEMHGRMHHNHCQITILLAHDPPLSLAYPMLTHPLPLASI